MLENGSEYYVEMSQISKEFSGVRVLNDVDFAIEAGKVNVLIGENGAGKSTLMRILAGAICKDAGKITINGKQVELASPIDAMNNGVAMVYQELNLVPDMSVADNIFLGLENARCGFLNKKKSIKAAQRLIDEYTSGICAEEIVGTLNVGQQQMVEIIKAVSRDAKVIVMDEPTSSLSYAECKELFKLIDTLKKKQVAIVYISHRMAEIFEIGDYVTVLRDGNLIGNWNISDITYDFLVCQMVGREISHIFPKEVIPHTDTVLKVDGLTKKGMFHDVSFELKRGEILGMAGLMGSGRTEIALTIYGYYKADGGKIYIGDKNINIDSPHKAIASRVAYISEDRKGKGLVVDATVKSNISLSHLDVISRGGFVNSTKENALVDSLIEKLAIKTHSPIQIAKRLSGGNQQKVVLAKWIFNDIDILILDEPTRGVDVGVKQEIYKIMTEIAKNGVGIIMISSELPEVLGMSDRILIMHEGEMMSIIDAHGATQEDIMRHATAINKKQETEENDHI